MGEGRFAGYSGRNGFSREGISSELDSEQWRRGTPARNEDLGASPTALTTKVSGDCFQISIMSRIPFFPGTEGGNGSGDALTSRAPLRASASALTRS